MSKEHLKSVLISELHLKLSKGCGQAGMDNNLSR